MDSNHEKNQSRKSGDNLTLRTQKIECFTLKIAIYTFKSLKLSLKSVDSIQLVCY